ncbi:HNH endonuclease [Flaviramulus basaltis]|uniref:HNH endonuclease n=1 Tax=Flaviramulus basaltis TaxID=369401 RepID=A0A1K2IR34_9FLAO|nr:HNH endonuclease [Flaviramulus basaltis]SFZ94905.1 HNH endonuclease [Flaviramulus basaltis]
MASSKKKRETLFNQFSGQLSSLALEGLLDFELKYERTFICPVCMKQFSEDALDTTKENFLTLEDAPPKSLGGTANSLSCKKCNNEFGHQIDYHLTEYLNEIDLHSFLPNTGSKATVTHKEIKVQGTVNVNENGKMTITHLKKVNKPGTLKEYVSKTGDGDITNIQFPATRVEYKKFEIALLKSAYFMAFEKYGYPLILSKTFDVIREQLNNPEKEIYPIGFWSKQSVFKTINSGVYQIITKGFEGFQAIFTLKTKASESGYGVYLPVSAKTYKNVIDSLKIQEAGFALQYMNYAESDFFNDKSNQKMCVEFMAKKGK